MNLHVFCSAVVFHLLMKKVGQEVGLRAGIETQGHKVAELINLTCAIQNFFLKLGESLHEMVSHHDVVKL